MERFPRAEARPSCDWVVEAGPRAGDQLPERYVGVSNTGGLAPFKGKTAKDTSRYRELRPGDLVYNQMRVNVGSIALCRREAEAGWVSRDYVVFRLGDATLIVEEYLLIVLNHDPAKEETTRGRRG